MSFASVLGGCYGWISASFDDPLDDGIDRLSSSISVALFSFFALVAAAKTSAGSSMITCAAPAHFDKNWVDFYSIYCYVQPYHVTKETGAPYTSFYPWIPIFLIIQAFLFYAPKKLWRTLSSHFEMDLMTVLSEAKRIQYATGSERKALVRQLATYMAAHLEFTHSVNKSTAFAFQSFTIVLYVLKKWLYVVVSVGQLCLIMFIVGNGNIGWIQDAFLRTLRGQTSTEIFPIEIFCSVPYVVDSNSQKREVGCILAMNLLFEKIYIIAYVWCIFVAVCTFVSAVHASLRWLTPGFRVRTVIRLLRLVGVDTDKYNYCIGYFIYSVLHADGLLTLILIDRNCGSALCEEVIAQLWKLSCRTETRDSVPLRQLTQAMSTDTTMLLDEPELHEHGHRRTNNLYPPTEILLRRKLDEEDALLSEDA